MTITILTTPAEEEGTYVVNMEFRDEDNVLVSPVTGTWTLTDLYGNVINSRTAVVIAVLDTDIDVVLSGNDLAIDDSITDDIKRRVRFKGTYNSSLGNGLALTKEAEFTITNHAAQA